MSRDKIVDKGVDKGSGKIAWVRSEEVQPDTSLVNGAWYKVVLEPEEVSGYIDNCFILLKGCGYLGGGDWEVSYVEPFTPKFKKGDKIRCIDSACTILKEGEIYVAGVPSYMSSSGEVVRTTRGGSYFVNRFELAGEDKKEEVVETFPHTVYVKFDSTSKEYAYLCDEQTYKDYDLWYSKTRGVDGKFRVSVNVLGVIKTPFVSRLKIHFKDPKATKCITPNEKEEQSELPKYRNYTKEEVDDLIKCGSLSVGSIGHDMWLRTGTINPDLIHPSITTVEETKATLGRLLATPHERTGEKGYTVTKVIDRNDRNPNQEFVMHLSFPPWTARSSTDGVHPTAEAMKVYAEIVWDLEATDGTNTATKQFNQTKEEVNMSNANRKVVSVKLIDNDSGLDVADSLVHDFGNIITEDDQTTTIQQLIADHDMTIIIDEHNAVRGDTDDLDILKRTGAVAKLRPIKLKNLTWLYNVV